MDGPGGTPVDLEEVGDGQIETSDAMSLDEIQGALQSFIKDAESDLGSESSGDRQRLTDAYYGRPYGDEQDGFSKVVARDVMETVEWMIAQLLRIFIGDRYCEFQPFDDQDVDSSEQQTDYTNHVIMQESGGALIFYDWFKDALLHRNGVVHWGFEEIREPVYESYTGLSQDQITSLMDESTEITELSRRDETMPGPDGQPMPVPVFDVQIKRMKRERKLKISVIPPEEFLILKRARTIPDSDFVGHKVQMSVSELVKRGVPLEIAEAAGGDTSSLTGESVARDVNRDSGSDQMMSDDPWLYVCYARIDRDGDGIAELLRIEMVGDTIVDIQPEVEIPYADLCPMRTPHRWAGLGYGDLVEDIQRIKTVLWRQGLDNLYLSNQPMKEVVEGKVNLADLQEVVVGGSVRVKEAGSIREIVVTPMTQASLQMVQYIDSARETRTGLSPAAMGQNASQLHDTAKGAEQQVSQAQMRVELVARLFAETGVKRLFMGVYNALVRNQEPERMVRLRGKFTKIDPREWRERNDVIVAVGLGVGTRETQLNTLQLISNMQKDLLQTGIPLARVQELEYTLRKFIETAGYRNTHSFLCDPSQVPPPPPKESEAIQIAKIQAQIEHEKRMVDVEKGKADVQIKEQEVKIEQARLAYEQQECANKEAQAVRDHEFRMTKLIQDNARAAAESAQKDQHFYDDLTHDAVIQRQKLGVEAEKARREAALDEAAMKLAEEPESESATEQT